MARKEAEPSPPLLFPPPGRSADDDAAAAEGEGPSPAPLPLRRRSFGGDCDLCCCWWRASSPSRNVREYPLAGERATMTLNRTSWLGAAADADAGADAPSSGSSTLLVAAAAAVEGEAPPSLRSSTARQQNTVPPTLSVMGWPHRAGLGRNSLATVRSGSEKKRAAASSSSPRADCGGYAPVAPVLWVASCCRCCSDPGAGGWRSAPMPGGGGPPPPRPPPPAPASARGGATAG